MSLTCYNLQMQSTLGQSLLMTTLWGSLRVLFSFDSIAIHLPLEERQVAYYLSYWVFFRMFLRQ